jgi:hypothetical protein
MADLTSEERKALLEMLLFRLGGSGAAYPSLDMCEALVAKGMLYPKTFDFTDAARALVCLRDE